MDDRKNARHFERAQPGGDEQVKWCVRVGIQIRLRRRGEIVETEAVVDGAESRVEVIIQRVPLHVLAQKTAGHQRQQRSCDVDQEAWRYKHPLERRDCCDRALSRRLRAFHGAHESSLSASLSLAENSRPPRGRR